MNRLIETLQKWKDAAEGKPAGLKEPAAYQRVIDEINRMRSEEAVNNEIRQRIDTVPIEELPKRASHCDDCEDCIGCISRTISKCCFVINAQRGGGL
jgi:hypothetical protein